MQPLEEPGGVSEIWADEYIFAEFRLFSFLQIVGVSEIRADEYGCYRIYRNGELQFSFGSKEKAIRYFIGMIGEPY